MTEPDFWDDNIAAQKTSQELNELKQTYENFHQMTDLFDESEILLEFLSEDESVHEELEEKLIELDKMMTSYEMTLLLSEPYDNNNAILEIHPGSGLGRYAPSDVYPLRKCSWFQSGSLGLSGRRRGWD